MTLVDDKVFVLTYRLIALGDQELKFKKFLRLELEQRQDLEKLLHALLKIVRKAGRFGKFDRKELFTETFPTAKTYQPKKLLGLLKLYAELLEDFMLYREAKNPLKRSKMLIDFYGRYGEVDLFEQAFQQAQASAYLAKDADHQLLMANLKELEYFYESNSNTKERSVLVEKLQHLDSFFLLKMLKSSVEILVKDRRRRVKDEDFETRLKTLISFFGDSDIPMAKFLLQAADFYLAPSLERYKLLKTCFLENIDGIHSDRPVLYVYSINSLSHISISVEERSLEYLFWYKCGDEKNLLLENNCLPSDLFNNAAYVAYVFKEYDWLEHFINKYSSCLPQGEKKSIRLIKLAKSYLLFGQAKFKEGLEVLKGVTVPDFQVFIRKNVLWFKLLYEVNRSFSRPIIEQRRKSFDTAMRGYLKKGKIDINDYNKDINFSKLLEKISRYYYKNISKESLFRTLENIKDEVVEYEWLKEKIEKLPGK